MILFRKNCGRIDPSVRNGAERVVQQLSQHGYPATEGAARRCVADGSVARVARLPAPPRACHNPRAAPARGMGQRHCVYGQGGGVAGRTVRAVHRGAACNRGTNGPNL